MHNEFSEKAGLGLQTEGIGSSLFYCLRRKTTYLPPALMPKTMQAVRRERSVRDEKLPRHVVVHRDIKLYDFQAGSLPGPPSQGRKTRNSTRPKKKKNQGTVNLIQ